MVRYRTAITVSVGIGILAALTGCPPAQPNNGFNNTTDPTNGGASYVGSAACSACHPDFASLNRLHGHNQALKSSDGAPPVYPDSVTRAGVPDPPDTLTWTDISYAIGGYTHGANFVDQNGFLLTDGRLGVPTRWALDFPPNGTSAQFNSYLPQETAPLPYSYDCFRCHVTGAVADNGVAQGGRSGIGGTWAEDGVHCEACHGPGSRHIPNPAARNNYVNTGVVTCAPCHSAAPYGNGGGPNMIPAAGGYVAMGTELNQMRASGGHAGFACTYCHDPHASTVYDPNEGLINVCTGCHSDSVHNTLPLHQGAVFRRGDYVEPLSCMSCHMGFIGLAASTATPAVAGPNGRMGDIPGHIFRINPNSASFTDMFTADGSQVALDANGKAGVTLDFICLRCHNGIGNAIPLTPAFVLDVAPGLHVRVASIPGTGKVAHP